ncbi:alpha/beta hydrolase [Amycolatopsis panacis]|uniref:Alpha/beta hydrolase n=1 Tax=Amycolatopsis panacis TaxID=2340917 RepID=A0A419HQY5_9PSEU|nr:alpha/beta hydrolase [Amycolatopsis panacis]RJQ78880.1 alpha/beta hydrolase [Amycolatopsis panacis]
MTSRAIGQSWALDAAIAQGGFDALHPQARGSLEMIGVDHSDFERVFSQVKAGAMMPKAWAGVAQQVETRAAHYRRTGFLATAADLSQRAATLWCGALGPLPVGDARRAVFREHLNRCVDHIGELRGGRVRRVALDFEGGHLYGLLHLPAGEVRAAPAVILGPGMDMLKEHFLSPAERYYTSRGMVALSIDGPGQGETRESGVTVGVTNSERALARWIDYLTGLPEVDADRIGMFGVSMGGYWGHRLAAVDRRLAALASFEGVTGEFATIFERAQPSFKRNYLQMSGYTDEEAFDRELVPRLPLGDLVRDIACPVLIGIGEFDELSSLEEIIASYERITAPKEIRVYENEFHPLGGVAAEMMRFGADWLERVLAGELAEPGRDERYYVRCDGEVTEGTAEPDWWRGAVPSALRASRSE